MPSQSLQIIIITIKSLYGSGSGVSEFSGQEQAGESISGLRRTQAGSSQSPESKPFTQSRDGGRLRREARRQSARKASRDSSRRAPRACARPPRPEVPVPGMVPRGAAPAPNRRLCASADTPGRCVCEAAGLRAYIPPSSVRTRRPASARRVLCARADQPGPATRVGLLPPLRVSRRSRRLRTRAAGAGRGGL